MEQSSYLPKSRHFTLDQLADGIYAAIHTHGGWALANAGIVDLGGATLIFDTFIAPAAAEDLRRAAEELTGRPAAYVINSHYHNDHIWGNQVFRPGAKFIATSKTHELMLSKGQEEFDWYKENSPAELSRLQEELAQEADPTGREEIAFWIPYYEALVDTMPQLEICYPHITFHDRMVISGARRSAEMITLGGGHTGDDVFMVFPDDSIAFLSDLLFIGSHPYLGNGDPENLLKILGEIADFGLETLVPGHGPVGGPADLEANRDYIRRLMDLADQLPADAEPTDIQNIPVPEQFSSWEFDNFFGINMQFLAKRR
jgi:glyoxylase-like metal-dependent hydrolase (beta-lactamase superfamily II)